jgi:positive regulator of sigma E activity
VHRHRGRTTLVCHSVDIPEWSLLSLARLQHMVGVIGMQMHVMLANGAFRHADSDLRDVVVMKPRLLPRKP